MNQIAQNELQYDDDEIDFRELIRTLVSHKKIIILTTLVTFFIALAYASSITPTYKAKVTFLPPTESDISHLNIPEIYIDTEEAPNRDQLYQRFAIALESNKVHQEAFNILSSESPQAGNLEDNQNKTEVPNDYTGSISLVRSRKGKKGEEVTPNLFFYATDNSPEIAAKIANTVSEVAHDTLKSEVINDINSRIAQRKAVLESNIITLREAIQKNKLNEIQRIKENNQLKAKEINDQINQLRKAAKQNRFDQVEKLKEADLLAAQKIKKQIESLRSIAKKKREDLIKSLEEAALIARNSGIVERSSSLSNQLLQDQSTIYTEINMQAQPLYLRGEKELRAEIKELKNRQSDDPFIPELRSLQTRLALLPENKEINILLARKNDDPFIPELRNLQKQLELLGNDRKIETLISRENNDPFIESLVEKQISLATLNNIQIEPSKIKLATFDQRASSKTAKKEKSKRSVIIALGAVLGLFFGILAAFAINFLQSIYPKNET